MVLKTQALIFLLYCPQFLASILWSNLVAETAFQEAEWSKEGRKGAIPSL